MPSFPHYSISEGKSLKRGDFIYLPNSGAPALVLRESESYRLVVDLLTFGTKSFRIDGHVFPLDEQMPDVISRGSGWRIEVLSTPIPIDHTDRLSPGFLVRSRDGWFLCLIYGQRPTIQTVPLEAEAVSLGYPPFAAFADWRIVFPSDGGSEPDEAFRQASDGSNTQPLNGV